MTRNQRLRPSQLPVVEVWAFLPADLENVAESGGDDERRPGPTALKQGVGRDGRSVNEERNVARRSVEPVGQLLDADGDASGLVASRRRGLCELQLAGLDVVEREVGERASYVYAKSVGHVSVCVAVALGMRRPHAAGAGGQDGAECTIGPYRSSMTIDT